MTFLKQTRLHTEEQDGNCWSTCIACMLGLNEIPDLNIREKGWFNRTQAFCNLHGHQIIEVALGEDSGVWFPSNIIVMATGRSPRQPKFEKDKNFKYINHTIIGKIRVNEEEKIECEFIHDPHPDNTFIETLESLTFIFPSNKMTEEQRIDMYRNAPLYNPDGTVHKC
jgi:hypothetical protein